MTKPIDERGETGGSIKSCWRPGHALVFRLSRTNPSVPSSPTALSRDILYFPGFFVSHVCSVVRRRAVLSPLAPSGAQASLRQGRVALNTSVVAWSRRPG